MATNEHNSSLEPVLTSLSGSTLAFSEDIDQAVVDIQNYIDSTKVAIDLSITNLGLDLGGALSGSTVNIENAISQAVIDIQSHVSGSTVDIDNFIDAAVTTINANVDSKTSNVLTINNAILGSGDSYLGLPNMNVGTTTRGKKCTSSGTEETLFYFYRPNYLFVQAWNDPSAGASAEVTVYYDSISLDNVIAHAIIPPGTSQIVCCFPGLADGACYITAKADGSNPVCVAAQGYTSTLATAVEVTNVHTNDMKHASPTTIYNDSSTFGIISYTSTQSMREFMQFDLSSIPSVAAISEAYLDLCKFDASDTSDFHIGLADEETQIGEVCWTNRKTGTPWSVQGDGHGSMMPSPIYSGSITGEAFDHLLFDLTDQVKGWIDGSIPNNGLILYVYPNHPVVFDFCGVTNSASENRPRLKVYIN